MARDAAAFDDVDPIARDAALTPIRDVTDRPDSALPSLRRFPVCKGCGTSVQAHGDVCEMCAQKPQFQAPKGAIEVKEQPKTAYEDGGPLSMRSTL